VALRGDGDAAPEREPRLDGLRGLAIALVLLYHTTHYGYASGPFETALTLLPSLGWSGVDLFFVLSGFLITGILLRARESPTYYRAFYARRVLRIFPLYYATLAFFLLLVPRLDLFAPAHHLWTPGVERHAWPYWLFLSNFDAGWTGVWRHHTLAITWSLAIEEHFYLLWPWLVRRLDARRLLAACAAIFAGAFALRVALTLGGAPPLAAYAWTPCRLDALATGAAIAVVAREPARLAALARAARLALPAALAAFLASFAWVRWAAAPIAAGAPPDAIAAQALGYTTHPWMRTVGYTLLCIVYGALLVWLIAAPTASRRVRLFEHRALCALGQYSYALYLFHYFVALLTLEVLAPARHPDQFVTVQLAFWLLAIGASLLAARASWVLLEEPLLRLKRRFPYQREGGG
jgi:peptidoglycan/LPS O-acetylase OafA/YrhL